jgi:hypothetical protein
MKRFLECALPIILLIWLVFVIGHVVEMSWPVVVEFCRLMKGW